MNEIKNYLDLLDFNILEDILNLNCKENFKYNITDDLQTNIYKYYKLSYKNILNGCISGICWGINNTTDYNRYFNNNKDEHRQQYILNKLDDVEYINCSFCEFIIDLYNYNNNSYLITDILELHKLEYIKERKKIYRLEQIKDLNIKDKFKLVLDEFNEYLNYIEEGNSLTKIEDISLYYEDDIDRIRGDYLENKVEYYRDKKEQFRDNDKIYIYFFEYNFYKLLKALYSEYYNLNCRKYKKYFKRASYLENTAIRKIFNKK